MRDVLPEIERWRGEGKGVALATVVKVWGSAPRPLGSKMAVSSAGEMAGSVSGGCVEGAVFEEAQRALRGDRPRLLHFGVADETAWSLGLSCGGEIEVFIEPLPTAGAPGGELYEELRGCLNDEQLVTAVVALDGRFLGRRLLVWPGGETRGDLGAARLNQRASLFGQQACQSFVTKRKSVEIQGEPVELFFEVLAPPPRLIAVGAVHVAIPLVAFAKILGMHTIVVDPRTAFATHERFGQADELLHDWPDAALEKVGIHESTSIAVLSHDAKLDLPALRVALRSCARYVGALGSPKTHAKRVEALRGEGFSAEEIARIHSPIGLDLGGRRADEIALAVIAQIVATSHGIGARAAAEPAPVRLPAGSHAARP